MGSKEVMETSQASSQKKGILYGVMAFTAWGFLPLYWKTLQEIPAMEILAHRILWSFVFVSILLFFKGGFHSLKEKLSDRRSVFLMVLAGLLITVNWFTYIWAVNANFVLQTSMGYYINPLIVSFLSMVVLKEKFNRVKTLALMLAFIGVMILTFQYGRVPWVALVLAFTFAFYGLVKKVLKVDSLTGMALETFTMTPVALLFIGYGEVFGNGSLRIISPIVLVLLVLTGAATATPLLWFAKGAQRVEFSTMGFLQYIAPTISFFLGVFLFKEPFTSVHLISFGFIWSAVILYSVSLFRFQRKIDKKQLPIIR